MKFMCRCGNIEELKSDSNPVNYEIRDCDDGSIALICKQCKAVVFINFSNDKSM